MLCILTIATSKMFERYIKLIIFAACFFTWQISHSSAACPTGWTEYSSNCYKVISNSQPYANAYEARQACLKDGGDMASVENAAVQSFLYDLVLNISGTAPQYMYIGMADIQQEGDMVWLDGTSVTYTNFSASEPDNRLQFNGEDCVAIQSSDKLWQDNGATSWLDVPCCFQEYGITSVACKRPVSGTVTVSNENDTIHEQCFGDCPTGWYKYKNKCYGLLTASSSSNGSYSARQTCLSNGADLPIIDSQNVSNHVTSIMRQKTNNTVEKVYLGLNDHSTEQTFMFLDGTSLSSTGYSNWASGSPVNNASENCVVMSSSDMMWNNDNQTTWQDTNCCKDQGVTAIMCQKPENSSVPAVLPDNDVMAKECFSLINECSSNPCQNGATCADKILNYECTCVPGYNGTHCETQIDYCSSSPCKNGGTCQKQVNSYNCLCTPGYNGTDCDNLYDHCLAFDPCQNNATCVNQVTYSNCTCVPGFEGQYCQINIDECKNLTCLNNGTCVDQINHAYCECPVRFSGANCGIELSCDVSNAIVQNANRTTVGLGGVPPGGYDFECLPGYKFDDMMTKKSIRCTSNNWDVNPTTLSSCQPHCDQLPTVANGDAPNKSTRVGTMLNYTCDVGHQMADNTTEFNITCLSGGNWSIPLDSVPQCEIVTCPELPTYPHQTLNKRNTTYNTTVTFWCDVGYVLHDNTTARTIKCLADGQWTAKLPPCEPVKCEDIPMPTGLTRNESAHVYNTYVRYTCDSDYRMMDGATYRIIKCDATGEWSDNVTECKNDRCFPLPFVANATPSDTLAVFGSRINLTCIKGHRFNPQTNNKKRSDIMECKTIGRWAPLLSACEPLYCNTVPHNVNSTANTTNQLFGTVIEIKCLKGYYFPDKNNSIITECYDDVVHDVATWSVKTVQPCYPTVCQPPPTVTNGTKISDPMIYNYSVQVKYQCDPEFKFIDGNQDRTIQCNEFGEWTLTDVSCRRERCFPVPQPSMVVPDTTNTTWDTVVTYQCAVGHHWANNEQTYAIECLRTGEWNFTNVPKCIINLCDPVPLALNTTTNTSIHEYNTYVGYTCSKGFKYSDNTYEKTRWCAPEKVWKPVSFPSCLIKHCPELHNIENATRDTNDTEYNTVATYNCEEGYQYPDKLRSKTVYCTENETWTEFPPPCEVVFCPPLPYWDADFNSTDNNFLSVVTYKCKSGEAFVDSNKDPNVEKSAKCLEAKIWDPPIEACKPINSIAKDLIGVTYDSEEAVPIGTIACSLVCLLFAAIILLDLNKIYEDLKMMKNNIESMMEHRKNKITDSNANIKDATESTA